MDEKGHGLGKQVKNTMARFYRVSFGLYNLQFSLENRLRYARRGRFERRLML